MGVAGGTRIRPNTGGGGLGGGQTETETGQASERREDVIDVRGSAEWKGQLEREREPHRALG